MRPRELVVDIDFLAIITPVMLYIFHSLLLALRAVLVSLTGVRGTFSLCLFTGKINSYFGSVFTVTNPF